MQASGVGRDSSDAKRCECGTCLPDVRRERDLLSLQPEAGSGERADCRSAGWPDAGAQARRTWGFSLCFLYLRNVKGHGWNHKRVYRIYCELELNMRIKSKKRLKREKPEELAVPDQPNTVWSMDFMADRLEDMRGFRLLNVVDDFNRHEWLDQYMFTTIKEVQDYVTEWLWTYNNDRLNIGLGGITPAQKLKQQLAA